MDSGKEYRGELVEKTGSIIRFKSEGASKTQTFQIKLIKRRYRVFIADDVRIEHQRWRRYPEYNWATEVPKSKGLTIGKETRFKKGQCARKDISHPIELDPKV